MRKLVIGGLLIFLLIPHVSFGQKKIRDKAITHQQERMVYKQWDKKKFTPSNKVLGVQVNPLWYTVWGMHPNYRKKDHRPLGPIGPQTSRMSMVTSLRLTEDQFEKESDSLRNIVLAEFARNSSLTPEPLWELYYKKEFKDLLNADPNRYLDGLTNEEKRFLLESKIWDSHVNNLAELKERLEQGRNEMADRGNRLMFYHSVLKEYRIANERWLSNRLSLPKSLSIRKTLDKQKTQNSLSNWNSQSDKQIAEKVVREFRYIN